MPIVNAEGVPLMTAEGEPALDESCCCGGPLYVYVTRCYADELELPDFGLLGFYPWDDLEEGEAGSVRLIGDHCYVIGSTGVPLPEGGTVLDDIGTDVGDERCAADVCNPTPPPPCCTYNVPTSFSGCDPVYSTDTLCIGVGTTITWSGTQVVGAQRVWYGDGCDGPPDIELSPGVTTTWSGTITLVEQGVECSGHKWHGTATRHRTYDSISPIPDSTTNYTWDAGSPLTETSPWSAPPGSPGLGGGGSAPCPTISYSTTGWTMTSETNATTCVYDPGPAQSYSQGAGSLEVAVTITASPCCDEDCLQIPECP